jgi:hypothetical protein
MHVTTRLACFAVLVSLAGAAPAACTWSDLAALGNGASDAGDAGPFDDAAGMDAPTPGTDSAAGMDMSTNPTVDSSAPAVDGAAPPIPDAADADEVGTVAPPQALPIYLDAGTASWCDQHPGYAFCADFDETALPAGFSASDGAFLIQTSSLPSSGPNDLLLLVPSQSGSGTWGSKLSRPFSTYATSVVLAFDFYPEVVSTGGMLFAGVDFLGNADAKYSVRLAFSNGAPRLEESYLGSPADVYHSNFSVPAQTWSRVQMELSLPPPSDGGAADAGTATESVYVDGVLQGTVEMLTPPGGFDSRPNLLVGGVYGTSPTGEWALRFDNVTFDIH